MNNEGLINRGSLKLTCTEQNMKKAEMLIVIFAVISLILNLLLFPNSGIFMTVILLVLSMLYSYLGFALFNEIELGRIFNIETYKDISTSRIIVAIGAGVVLSMTTIGILFKFQFWPGASYILGVSLAVLLIVLLIVTFMYRKSKAVFYIRIYYRLVIFGGIGLSLMLLQNETILEFKYRNHPDYIEVYKKALADPENQELWDELQEEQLKMGE